MTQPSASLRSRYQQLVASGAIEADAAQARAVELMGTLDEQLRGYRPRKNGFASGLLSRLFGNGKAKKGDGAPQGLYIHGEVGRGKTMLMDLFFQNCAVANKRRAHFHEFMAEIHERIYGFRQQIAKGEIEDDVDPVKLTAHAVFEEAWLLCFDEFHVTDIADAMILGRLFARLFELGTVVVATSNVAPDDLYKGGLNRALFLPFIGAIKEHMNVLRLDSRTDFRMEKLAGVKMWLVPDDAAAGAALDAAWLRLTGGYPGAPREIAHKGRVLRVPHSADGVARFSFDDLCVQPMAASDYLRFAHDYHTVMIDHIPQMGETDRNPAKRFITLIDTFYDNAVKLIASAEVEPERLYQAETGIEIQEFKRTVSRLTEMGSESYLALPHGRSDSTASGASTGLVET
ncbi:MAG TPA: cell division protein ZapE [Xanthobacteraceae bacterium]|nr:cell division protein ZapE [Xanthobacteraceae bacterium]HWW49273.1 cell division protein ZapE [Xanthobacteraceae bacterium]